MSASYSLIACVTSSVAVDGTASYGPRPGSRSNVAFEVLNSLGTIMFAFGGHAVLLEIQVGPLLIDDVHRDDPMHNWLMRLARSACIIIKPCADDFANLCSSGVAEMPVAISIDAGAEEAAVHHETAAHLLCSPLVMNFCEAVWLLSPPSPDQLWTPLFLLPGWLCCSCVMTKIPVGCRQRWPRLLRQ